MINKPGLLEMTMPDDDQHALHIAKVKSTDVGQLIFMANNQYGSDLCTLQLVMAGECGFPFVYHTVQLESSSVAKTLNLKVNNERIFSLA